MLVYRSLLHYYLLNGNRLAFLEPLEANSSPFYNLVSTLAGARYHTEKKELNKKIQREADKIQNFIMWHYAKGSKYETPFWDYAIPLSKGTFDKDEEFLQILEFTRSHSMSQILGCGDVNYSQWHGYSVQNWDKVQ